MTNCDDFRSYIDHFQAEHRRLHTLINKTKGMFPEWEEVDLKDWVPRIVERLQLIRTELIHHFREEEDGGCLEEAASHCPSMAHEVSEVESQHPQLLKKLDELIQFGKATSKPTIEAARRLQQDFQNFTKELRLHEALEQQIVQKGFNTCINGEGDVDAAASPKR